MQLSYHRKDFEFSGQRLDDALLSYRSWNDDGEWSIDVSAVLWMLDRIADGSADAATVHQQLRQVTSWASECCSYCDRAAPYYDEAKARQDAVVARWQQDQDQLDPVEYPYILNKSKIHKLSCRRPSKPSPPAFPESLHKFAVFFEASGENLDALFTKLDRDSTGRGARRYSVSEVQDRIARFGMAAVEARLCGGCRPPLPDLDPSTSAARPASWEWPSDQTVLDQLRSHAKASPSVEASLLPEHRVSFAMLELWQAGRCAVCGEVPTRRPGLVRDHDHASGMIRGLLCNPCNTAESRASSLLFDNYRKRPPVKILAVEVLYLPLGFRPGVHHLGPRA